MFYTKKNPVSMAIQAGYNIVKELLKDQSSMRCNVSENRCKSTVELWPKKGFLPHHIPQVNTDFLLLVDLIFVQDITHLHHDIAASPITSPSSTLFSTTLTVLRGFAEIKIKAH